MRSAVDIEFAIVENSHRGWVWGHAVQLVGWARCPTLTPAARGDPQSPLSRRGRLLSAGVVCGGLVRGFPVVNRDDNQRGDGAGQDDDERPIPGTSAEQNGTENKKSHRADNQLRWLTEACA